MTVEEEVRERTRRWQPPKRRALYIPRAVERIKLPPLKVHQKKFGKKCLQVVDGGGRRCYSAFLKHERLANVIRTVINRGRWFRAEPCLKQGLGQRGFPQTPFPKSHNSKSYWFTYCSRLISFVD